MKHILPILTVLCFSFGILSAKDPAAAKSASPASSAISVEKLHMSLIGDYTVHLSKDVPGGAILTKEGGTSFGTLIPTNILPRLKRDVIYYANVNYTGGKLVTRISTAKGAENIGTIGDTYVGLSSPDKLTMSNGSGATSTTTKS
jgi:hypothetical protein